MIWMCRHFLKLHVLLYADDTVVFSGTAKDIKNAINATLRYCDNNMWKNSGKTEYMMFSRNKIRKNHAITAYGHTIERVETFCYLGIVFRPNNILQARMKHINDKAKKALYKLKILLSRVDLQLRSRLHIFDSPIR